MMDWGWEKWGPVLMSGSPNTAGGKSGTRGRS
ncbi:hypothetical protein TorRG33x02_015260 [Trema orientale]|uniref:Uncharacterized protein n=1 Tax=Trema orientale TaxID=63057 RepID=A0A2P5FXL6_TREOI|nr:hypothetical protein TorRG33x02_015260 [Trema orientale]